MYPTEEDIEKTRECNPERALNDVTRSYATVSTVSGVSDDVRRRRYTIGRFADYSVSDPRLSRVQLVLRLVEWFPGVESVLLRSVGRGRVLLDGQPAGPVDVFLGAGEHSVVVLPSKLEFRIVVRSTENVDLVTERPPHAPVMVSTMTPATAPTPATPRTPATPMHKLPARSPARSPRHIPRRTPRRSPLRPLPPPPPRRSWLSRLTAPLTAPLSALVRVLRRRDSPKAHVHH